MHLYLFYYILHDFLLLVKEIGLVHHPIPLIIFMIQL
jgi:hypothetical protein